MSHDIKAMIRRAFEEGINRRDFAVFEDLLGPDYVNHSMPAPAPGPTGFRQVIGMFISAFPDMQITVEEVLADGDRVATRGYFTGTHGGEFMGVKATGKPIKVPYIDVWHLRDGKLRDNWVQMDMLGLMQQLGVVPTPGG